MAGERLTRPGDTELDAELDAAAVAVIDSYLQELSRRIADQPRLDSDVYAELRADLTEATLALLPSSAGPVAAARRATCQFGEVDELADAFRPELAVRRARRMGWALLTTGPIVGLCWLVAVFSTASDAGTAWRWLPLLMVPLLLVGAPATALTVASTGRLTRWLRPDSPFTARAVAVAGLTAGTLDLLLLLGSAALLLWPVPAPSPLIAVAAAASLARLALVGRAALRAIDGKGPSAAVARQLTGTPVPRA